MTVKKKSSKEQRLIMKRVKENHNPQSRGAFLVAYLAEIMFLYVTTYGLSRKLIGATVNDFFKKEEK